jgi:hypothetical protein
MNDRARQFWARTKLHVWPERYWLVSLPPALLAEAAGLAAQSAGKFAALVLERDEASLTIEQGLWESSDLRARARAQEGPFRIITFDVDIDLDVCGYLAPAAARLAEAGISIVPQCAYLKDHILVHEKHLDKAVRLLEEFMSSCRG